MKRYTLFLIAMLMMPFAVWAQGTALQKMVAANASGAAQRTQDSAEEQSAEEIQAAILAGVAHADAQAGMGDQTLGTFEGSVSPGHELTISNSKAWTVGQAMSQLPRRAARKAAAKVVLGGYFASDVATSGTVYPSTMTLFNDESGNYKMANVYSQADTISLSVDLDAGTVTIPAQKLLNYESIGQLWICPVNISASTYNPSASITGTIDGNGLITLPAWGIFVIDPSSSYNGKGVQVFSGSTWKAHNSRVVRTNRDGVVENEDALIEQTSANEITIYNFGEVAASVSARITPQKTVKVSPQVMLTSSTYGDFLCYPVDFAAGKIYMTQPIEGTLVGDTISFGNWVICQRDNNAGAVYKYESTKFVTDLQIAWPEALNVSFKGEGTETSPYEISSLSDLNMLAQSVNGGEKYTGKYFKQTQDISMAAQSGSYQPVGELGAYFDGTFDGASYTISDLTLDSKGFSNTGIFGYVGTGGTIKNVKVKNFKLTTAGPNAGVIAGFNAGTVTNCSVTGTTLTNQSSVAGGVVAYNVGTVSYCSSSASSFSGIGNTGGVVGTNQGTVSHCNSSANVYLTGYYANTNCSAGGIVGFGNRLNSVYCTIEDCYFTGTVTDAQGYGRTAGIIASVYYANINRCFNVGTIYCGGDKMSTVAVAGVVGVPYSINMADCYNAGLVMNAGTNKSVGGLIGNLQLAYTNKVPSYLSTIKNCYNSGVVSTSTLHDRSGLFGNTFYNYGYDPASLMMSNCYSDKLMPGLDDNDANKETSYFTSGTLPEGFSSDTWQAEAGFFPVLKTLAGTYASKLSSAWLEFNAGESGKKVKHPVTFHVPASADVNWGLLSSSSSDYVSSTSGMTISGNTVKVNNVYSTEVLAAYASDKSASRMFILAAVPKMFEGEGTEASPYLIKTAADFETLHHAVAESGQPHEGDFFKMTNDIDFSGSTFQGVNGTTTYYFSGNFDGDNHYIHNLSLSSAKLGADGLVIAKESYKYAALFGTCSKKSTIRNVRMAKDNTFRFHSYSAPLVGYTKGKVTNCRNYADVEASNNNVAGVVAYADSSAVVSGCYNAGHIRVGASNGAGIVAYNYKGALVELSQNDGLIDADSLSFSTVKKGLQSTVGGIVASNYGTIDRCVNNATVATYKQVGGITGTNSVVYGFGNITNSLDNGLIETWDSESTARGAISSSAAKGTVSGNYYDASVVTCGAANNTSMAGVTASYTSVLISGKALAGFNASEWSFAENMYPVLKAFEDEEAAKALRKTYIAFGENEVVSNVQKATSLSADTNIKWTLAQGKNFAVADGMLSVTPAADMTASYDTLTATYGSTGITKTYYLGNVPVIFDGAGTSASPFQIKSKADMDKLAETIEKTGMDYQGCFFKVMNDIDYAGDSLKVIATGTTLFQGDFDGNGKTIKGYVYEDVTTKTGKYLGLFANVGSSATIHNLTLDGSITGHSYTGVFAGKLYGTLRNCVNKGTVTSKNGSYAGGLACASYEGALIDSCSNEGTATVKTSYAAGIVALSSGSTISNCVNKGTANAPSGYCAGIVGSSNGYVLNCHNEGTLTSKSYTAGIVAYTNVNDTIIGCWNTADITATGSTLAGIAAYGANKANRLVKDCWNTGKLTATGTIGGIFGTAGSASYGSGVTIENCWNTGDLVGTATTGGSIGGIAAKVSSKAANKTMDAYYAYINNCWNSGNITAAAGSYCAGICSSATDSLTYITDCYNLGDITVGGTTTEKWAVSGIAGTFGGTLSNCWNAGNIQAPYQGVGGLVGVGQGGADRCANYGSIKASLTGTSTNKGVGGLWGYQAPTITNCISMGSISGATLTAGILSFAYQGAVVKNTYNTGLVSTTDGGKTCSNTILYKSSTSADDAIKNNLVDKVYYDASVNTTTFPSDSIQLGTPLATQRMFSADLGDAFSYHHAAYPTISSFKESSVPNFFAANVEYIEQGDTATNITGKFYVACLEGVTVSSSANISITDSIATPTATGEGWIKYATELHGKKFEKTFTLTISSASGIDGINGDGKKTVAREYYDINGVRYDAPLAGRLYIVKSVFSDGTSEVRKIYVK